MTNKRYLLDSNFLIYALPFKKIEVTPESTAEEIKLAALQEKTSQTLSELISAKAILTITPVIQYELLYDAKSTDERRKLKEDLADLGCTMIQVNQYIAELAAEIFRTERDNQAPDKKKHKFDILHLATAKHENLELMTCDQKLLKLKKRHLQEETP
jgi:predicted nucleic acid-binding protein